MANVEILVPGCISLARSFAHQALINTGIKERDRAVAATGWIGDLHGIVVGHVNGAILTVGGAVLGVPLKIKVVPVAIICKILIIARVVIFPMSAAIHKEAKCFIGVLHTLPSAAQIPAAVVVIVVDTRC